MSTPDGQQDRLPASSQTRQVDQVGGMDVKLNNTRPSSDPPFPSTTIKPMTSMPNSHAGPSTSRGVYTINGNAGARVESVDEDEWSRDMSTRKRKWSAMGFGPDEMEGVEMTAMGYQLALHQDQHSTMFPSRPKPFTSPVDVVDKLLPYHVWQIHDSELQGQPLSPKSEAERDDRDMRDAIYLTRKIASLKERFAKARQKEGTHPSPLPSLITMINHSTSTVREELAVVSSNLRSARVQYEAIQVVRREKERERERTQAAAAAVARFLAPTTPTPSITSSRSKPTTSTSSKPSANTPNNEDASDSQRGRPRGRPRGRGRGNMAPATVSHIPKVDQNQTGSSAPNTPAAAKAGPSAGAIGGSTTPSTPHNSSTPQPPVSITVSMNMIPQFVNVGLLVIPAKENGPKPPGTVIRTTEDRKNVVLSINLSACNQTQLQVLAKLLNVRAKGDTPTTPSGDYAKLSGGSSTVAGGSEGIAPTTTIQTTGVRTRGSASK